ncbi:hypothetical protein FLX08_06360 [Microbispora hainanensis]|uniref:Uncharacterized protein n=1 Tax=Microbispora hainanensis TaxID=568844 RepID=A0A544Z2C7_9ACTN|nr:hypothetical protein FLX08_06360 [Microbispora hainanensis]
MLRDVVRKVVADCAPEETVVVEGLLRYSDAEVPARLRRRRHGRDPLGFGLDDVVPLVTPLLWLTLESARQKLTDAAVDQAARGSVSLWRRIRRRKAEPATIPPLTREQQALVKRMVLDAAAEAGLSESRAKRIADGVVAGLALAEPGEFHGDADVRETR